MKRGYGEKLLVGGDSVTLTSNLLACVAELHQPHYFYDCVCVCMRIFRGPFQLSAQNTIYRLDVTQLLRHKCPSRTQLAAFCLEYNLATMDLGTFASKSRGIITFLYGRFRLVCCERRDRRVLVGFHHHFWLWREDAGRSPAAKKQRYITSNDRYKSRGFSLSLLRLRPSAKNPTLSRNYETFLPLASNIATAQNSFLISTLARLLWSEVA